MKPHQKKHINKRLNDLVRRTTPHVGITTALRAEDLITDVDEESLEAERKNNGEIATARKMYKILLKNDAEGGYEVLIQILKDENQSGAVTILEEISAATEEEMEVERVIVSVPVQAVTPVQRTNKESGTVPQQPLQQQQNRLRSSPTVPALVQVENLDELL